MRRQTSVTPGSEKPFVRAAMFLLLTLSGCSTTTPLPEQAPDPPREWERLVRAAAAEQRVVVAGPPGAPWRNATLKFEADYPDIKVEFLGGAGREHATRILAERRGGEYQWDVLMAGAATGVGLKAESALAPLQGVFLLPGVDDEKSWLGGFHDGWIDRERRYVYCFMGEASPEVYVNREFIDEDQLKGVEELLDPKWRGKISWNDPRVPGGGSLQAANLLYLHGENFLRKLFAQDVVIVNDLRQQVDWAVRGKFPIAMSLDYRFLAEFQRSGVGLKVVPLAPGTPSGGGSRLSPGYGCVMLLDRPPHPSAARVFINWLASTKGQNAYVQETDVNSRRLDAIAGRPEARPRPGVKYYNLNREEMLPYNDKAIAIAKEVLR